MAELKRDKMAEFVVDEFQRYESFHSERFQEMEDIYDLWLGVEKTAKQPWMNNVHVPMLFEGEQTITPRLFVALFPTDAPVDVTVEGDAPMEQGNKIKATIQHYFRVSDAQGKALPMLTQNTIFGTGYCEGGLWYTKFGWQTDEAGERYFTPIESRPDVKWVNFFEMYPHPAKLEIGDGLPLIRRRFCDAEYLKRLKSNPFFETDKLDDALQSESPIAGDMHGAYQKKKEDEYEILEYFGPYEETKEGDNGEVTSTELVPHWIIVINRSITIRGIVNPFNHQKEPFCKITMYPDAKPNWFGVGVGKIGKSSCARLNKIVNQRLDNVDLVINRQWLAQAGDNYLNRSKLQISQPGAVHDCADPMTSLKPLETPDVTASSYKEEEIAKIDFRESTGATSQLMPTESQHRTALGIQLLQSAAGMRFRPILRKIEIDYIQQLAMFFYSNLQQFMSKAEWVVISGEMTADKPILVSPEDIQAKVFFIPTGVTETLHKEIEIQNLLKYKEITKDDPTINRAEINRRIGDLFGFKDMSKLIVQQQNNPQSSLPPQVQEQMRQRQAEGASPQQIKQEVMGNPPGPGQNMGR